jgi:hypothetical protein
MDNVLSKMRSPEGEKSRLLRVSLFAEPEGMPSSNQVVPPIVGLLLSPFEGHPIHFRKRSIDLNQTVNNRIHINVYVGWATALGSGARGRRIFDVAPRNGQVARLPLLIGPPASHPWGRHHS